MSAAIDHAEIVHSFLVSGVTYSSLLDPYDFDLVCAGKAGIALPAGLRGKLATLRAIERGIHARCVKEQGTTVQDWSGRRLYGSSGFFSDVRELNLNEDKEISHAREDWYCKMSPDEKTAFDDHCLAITAHVILPLFPPGLSPCLQGPLARLALENVRLLKVYEERRAELQRIFRNFGTPNPNVARGYVDRSVHDQKDAQTQLEGRWLRELTREQQDALDGVLVRKPKTCRKNRTSAKCSTAKTAPNRGGRPRSDEVEEVQAYIYKRWIDGDKLAAIRSGAEARFGNDRAPKEDAHVTREANRYVKKYSLPSNRQK